jgi:hypothetical protein
VDNADGNDKDNKDGERGGGGGGGKGKECPILSTHNITFFKQASMYDVRTNIFTYYIPKRCRHFVYGFL